MDELFLRHLSLEKPLPVPPTPPDTYITGLYALNITSPDDDTSGDTHGHIFFWNPSKGTPPKMTLAGPGQEINTASFWSDFGIYEGRERLRKMRLPLPRNVKNIYIANHYRAILDLIYHSLVRYEDILALNGATWDWLSNENQREFLFSKVVFLFPALSTKAKRNLLKWMNYERNYSAG
jgi:hypothetical protein